MTPRIAFRIKFGFKSLLSRIFSYYMIHLRIFLKITNQTK